MSTDGAVAAEVLQLVLDTRAKVGPGPVAERLGRVAERLDGPLRVAIAGRVKAGKSTLLNALVGERLAPTDSGECTKVVSWYRRGQNYDVSARLGSGERRQLSFKRVEGALDVDLGDLGEDDVTAIDVQWPASTLDRITLIDTPGLESINDENSRRTRDFLEADSAEASDADAVIYLMRHLHRSDVEFLDAYMDRTVSSASPVNAVAVLSRADEIGAARPDAMESAARIAERYRTDPNVAALAATVVPMAGLLAETGLTLREDEAASLRMLAGTRDEVLEHMLMSAEQFCDIHASDLTVEIRRELLGRLGMFGVRLAVDEIRAGADTAAALAPRLVEHSGLTRLQAVIEDHFLPRARTLQARTAIVSLRSLAPQLREVDAALADEVDREAERIESSAVEFAQLRAATLVANGELRLGEDERVDLDLLLMGAGPAALGLGDDASDDQVRSAALEAVDRWRSRAADPLADPALVEVCEIAARTSEAIYARLVGS